MSAGVYSSAGAYGPKEPKLYAKLGGQGLEVTFNQLLNIANQAESTEAKKSAFEKVFQFAKKNSHVIHSPHLIDFFYAYATSCYAENTTEGWLNTAGFMELSALLQLQQKRELDSGVPFSLDMYSSLNELADSMRFNLLTLDLKGQPLFALDNVLRKFESRSEDRQQLSNTYKSMSQALLANYKDKLNSYEFLENVSNLAKQLIEDPEELKEFENYSGAVLAFIPHQQKISAAPAVAALQTAASTSASQASSPAPLVTSHQVQALKPARSNDVEEDVDDADSTLVTPDQQPAAAHWLSPWSVWNSVSTLATSYFHGSTPE